MFQAAKTFYTVECGQNAVSACERSLNYEMLNAGAFFVFRQNSETYRSASRDTA